MLRKNAFALSALALVALSVTSAPRAYCAGECLPITPETIKKLESFMDKQSIAAGEAPSSANTHILSSEAIDNKCYRKLVFTSGASSKLRSVYLTPDQQYLSTGLSDLSVDPMVERAAAEAAIAAKLKDGDVRLGLGDPAAPLVMTVFEDYECSYCRRLSDWIAALPDELKARTYVVSKNLPLPSHPWAKEGAKLALCAYKQSPEAFTMVRNVLFVNQEAIQETNFLDQITSKLDIGGRVDTAALLLCYRSNGDTDKQIERDVQLATALEVARTPTVFLNGKRLTHLTTYQELIAALSATPDAKPEELNQAKAPARVSVTN